MNRVMRVYTFGTLLVLILLMQACMVSPTGGQDSDFFMGRDPESFGTASPLDSFNLGGLNPTDPATYVELRFAGFGNGEVSSSTGSKCSEADDLDVCTTEFDGLTADSGFGTGCLPGYCYYYLAINRGNENFVIVNSEEMLPFFGSIDAALLNGRP